jgi:hypothetical protein
MKKIVAMLLLLTMLCGVFAGCGEEPAPATVPTQVSTLADAKAYLQAMYKENDGTACFG